eukprot:6493913-Pyramimonas_sp.AAC.1
MFEQVASDREEDWALGPEKIAWSEKMSKRCRAMRRDVNQAIIKAKKQQTEKGTELPKWLVPFIEKLEAGVRTG